MENLSKSKKLAVGRKMPPSYHKLPGEEYNPYLSETLQWLLDQLEILEFVWDHFKQSKHIIYDAKTGKWQGVDYGKELKA